MTEEIQKTTDKRAESLAKARAAKAEKRAAAAAAPVAPIASTRQEMSLEDAYAVIRRAQEAQDGGTVMSPQPAPPTGVAPTAAQTPQPRVPGRVEVKGRNGEVLSRGHIISQDRFDVPPHMVPTGWEYQWNTIFVTGNPETARDQQHIMHTSGWRPVPAERHAGVLVPAGERGEIMRGGLRLEERPKVMSDEARHEELMLARQLISDRNESLKLSGMRKNLGDGFEMSDKYKGTGGNIRMSIDRNLDVAPPKHTLAEPGE